MKMLVTGAAGFIGFHVARALIDKGEAVVGIDNLNDYYDVSLKEARLAILQGSELFDFYREDIVNWQAMQQIFDDHQDISCVIHLAAQAGVRYSLIDPQSYQRSNLEGVLVLLEVAKSLPDLDHLVFSSSSSVYGGLTTLPCKVTDVTDKPMSLYAATKKAGELMCHTYAHLYGIPVTCLRFFTVYGPWGRPDMAVFVFTKKILSGEPIDVFNNGNMRRDFTYIDDIVAGVLACVAKPPALGSGEAPYAVFNIGNHRSEKLMDFIGILEKELGHKAEINFLPMQQGEVLETFADIENTRQAFGFEPKTNISDGVRNFILWYREFYGV